MHKNTIKNNFRICFIIGVLLNINSIAFCQNTSLILVDSVTNDPLPFANIALKLNHGIGFTTDLSGKAQLDVSGRNFLSIHDTIICTYLGYEVLKIPIDFSDTQSITGEMIPKSILMNNIEVTAVRRKLTAIEIVENAVKSIKDNYPKSPININSFYREIIHENNQCIQLNEAYVKLHYNGYKQKRRFVKKSWRHYWKDAVYGRIGIYGSYLFSQPQSFYYFGAPNDKAQILATRTSENWSKEEIEPIPKGGPIALIAADKVKFQYDFLDKKNFDKYNYKLLKAIYYNNTLCYQIRFAPKQYGDKVFQKISVKMKYAIYSGTMYVDVESFAVVGFNCQTADPKNFEGYESYPFRTEVSCQYQKIGSLWYPESIETKQFNSLNSAGKQYNYTCVRELNMLEITNEDVQVFEGDDLLEHQQLASLREFSDSYDDMRWVNCVDKWGYAELDNKDKKQLEAAIPLSRQAAERYKQKDIPVPNINLLSDTTYLHGDTLVDNYKLLANSEHEIDKYLRSENGYFRNYMVPSRIHRKGFYYNSNLISRNDTIANSFLLNGKTYYWDTETQNQPVLYQKNDRLLDLVIDLNQIKIPEGSMLQQFDISPNDEKILLCFGNATTIGMDCQVFHTSNINIAKTLNQVGDIKWLDDNSLVYTVVNNRRRADQVFYSTIDSDLDTLIYLEKDSTFYTEIFYDKIAKSLKVKSESANESDIYLATVDGQIPELRKFAPSVSGHKYDVYVSKDSFYILTNYKSEEFWIAQCDILQNSFDKWERLLTSSRSEKIDEILILENYILVKYIVNASLKLKALDIKNRKIKDISFGATPTEIYMSKSNLNARDVVEIKYSSPNLLPTHISLNLNTLEQQILSEIQIKDRVSLSDYVVDKLFVPAENDTVPVTIYYKKAIKDLHKGLILKSYGAYGNLLNASFEEEAITWMDMGYTIAIAHVRGGRARGASWYNDGKLLSKINSMTDYIDCAEYLIEHKYTSPEYLVSYGQSAGGLVQGYVLNERPDLFKAMIFDHPYLDVINTMKNDELALTNEEKKEWGDINNKQHYDYIKSYSPYQNIRSNDYPNLLFFAGKKDFQTPYWQIANSVLKLRDNNTGENEILFYTNMRGRHMESANWKQKESYIYAFVVKSLFGSYEEFENVLKTTKE